MAVQDDKRERLMCRLLKLKAGGTRSGVDAFLDTSDARRHFSIPLELKSTTTGSISTARDVGMDHIAKWRQCVWLFGFFDRSGKQLSSIACLSPSEMEPWIGKIETYIRPDFMIGEQAARRLTLEDLYIVCGEKPQYSVQDAKALHKRQWSAREYTEQMDTDGGYTPDRMLEILKLRALYLNEHGSTLNNPHIPATHFSAHHRYTVDAGNKLSADTLRQIHEKAIEGWREIQNTKS